MAEPKKRVPQTRAMDQLSDEGRDAYLSEMARRRRTSFGMLAGAVSLSFEEALAPLAEEEIKAWGLD